MPDLTQSSFTAGEVDPALWGRKDQGIYSSGLRRAVNMIVHEGGGIYNREGFRFVGRIKDEARGARLLYFKFTTGDEYLIEAGHNYFRFWRDDAAILSNAPLDRKGVENVTKGADTVVTLEMGHGLTTAGQQFYIFGVDGMPEINNRMFAVKSVSTNDVTLGDPTYHTEGIDSRQWQGAYTVGTSGGDMDTPYEVATPYDFTGTADHLSRLDYSQVGDIVTVVSGLHPVYELRRMGHSDWTFTEKMFPDRTVGMGDDAEEVNSGDLFDTAGEYPSAVGFFQQRRLFAGRPDTPDTILYSAIGDYDFFDANALVTDDSAFAATLATPTFSSIRHVVSLKNHVVILTDDAQWAVRASGSFFSARTMFQFPELEIGSDLVKPIVYDDDVVFVRNGGRSLVGVRFDGNQDSYLPTDMTLTARHAFACDDGSIVALGTFYDRIRRVMTVTAAGQIAHASINRAYQLNAWTRWITQGKFTAGMYATPNGERFYNVVRRTVAGKVRHFIETAHPHRRDVNLEDQFFVDAGATYAGGSSTAGARVDGRYDGSGVFFLVRSNTDEDAQYDACAPDETLRLGGWQYDDSVPATGYLYVTTNHRPLNDITDSSGSGAFDTSIAQYLDSIGALDGFIYGPTNILFISYFIWIPKDVVEDSALLTSKIRRGSEAVLTLEDDPLPSPLLTQVGLTATNRYPDVAAFPGAGYSSGSSRWLHLGRGVHQWVFDNTTYDVDDAATRSYLPLVYPRQNVYIRNSDGLVEVQTVGEDGRLERWVGKQSYTTEAVLYGSSHLEGEQVVALADGSVLRDLTVLPGGRLDLGGQYGRVHVGFPYRSEIETLDLEIQGRNTSDQLQSVSEVNVKVHDSKGLQYRISSSQTDYQELPSRDPMSAYDTASPLFTGDVILPVSSPWARSIRVALRQDDPLPMTILSMTPEFDIQDRR